MANPGLEGDRSMQQGQAIEIEGTPVRRYNEMLERRQDTGFFICAGIDPNMDSYKELGYEMPRMDIMNPNGDLSEFLYARAVDYIDAVADYAAVFKSNAGFYEQYGLAGEGALHRIVDNIKDKHPEIPIIGDVKRGDIDNTQKAYAKAAFNAYGFDAATVNPYMSDDAVMPFADYKDKGTVVLVRTSNPSGAKTQNVVMEDGQPYWKHIAQLAATDWNKNGNISVVVGATNPKELSEIREIIGPDMQILAPGVGTQGGTVEDVVKAGNDKFVINYSRGLLYAKPKEGETHIQAMKRAAKTAHEEIQTERARLAA